MHKAALARIRRMVAPKKKRRDLEAPQFLKDQWQGGKGVRDNLAELLKRVNFDKDCTSLDLRLQSQFALSDLFEIGFSFSNSFANQDVFLKKVEISVRKDKVIEVTISEGWYSEQEMSQDLKWSAWGTYSVLKGFTAVIVPNSFQCNSCSCHLMFYHRLSRARIAGAKRVCEAAPDQLVRQGIVFIQS